MHILSSKKVLHKIALFALVAFLCLFIIFENFYNKFSELKIDVSQPIQSYEVDDSEANEVDVIVLWWTPFIGELQYTKNCGDSICRFTGNRKYFNHAKMKVNFSISIKSSTSLNREFLILM